MAEARDRWAAWTEWSSKEALSRVGVPRSRSLIDAGAAACLAGWLVWAAHDEDIFAGLAASVPLVGLVCCGLAYWQFHRATARHRLGAAFGWLAVPLAIGAAGFAVDAQAPAYVLWIICAVGAMERLPLAVALPFDAVMIGGFLAIDETLAGALGSGFAVLIFGYALRLDAQARGAGFLLLAQERVARVAEAESAALAERARIARDIHDVLAHSLSAQTVHLEAARLLIERGGDREQILERVVAARAMAREGLAETRQALSALRGDMAPVEDYLRELAAADGAAVAVEGVRRALPAEASQTVRRVAQEALTNVRKHAPGAEVRMRLAYEDDEVALDIRDSGGPVGAGELGKSGCGYGLLGMRERAELLGGTLEAGPEEGGFVVRLRLRVPA
ncbi:sensor histidine kinase [Streptomyces sp. NBC_01304]|uniref:sensor histidine kinase n=1 Tax=Streptomyces sp. NBC_01304 TaxID=2903818 RepID=UPI002E12AEE1|nr:histidine kinase [Streptomyces sp. NBC_01304]